ncbi:MAG: ComEC/Rec2 family competence protein, partial [Verrucomicrobiota bacterium]
MIRRPFAGWVLSVLIGTWAGLQLSIPTYLLLISAFVLCIVGLVFVRRSFSTLLLHLAVILTAWLSADLRKAEQAPRHFTRLMASPAEQIQITGVVQEDPAYDEIRPGLNRCRIKLKLEGLRRTTEWEKAEGLVQVRLTAESALPEVAYGEKWQFAGLLRQSENPRFRFALFHTVPEDAARLSRGHGSPLVAWCLDARRRCSTILERGIEDFPDESGILKALLLGYREDLPREEYQLFASTGTLHIFAISGLHVGVMGLLMIGLLKLLGLSRQQWILALGPLLLIYVLMTGAKVSAMRAWVMAVVYGSAFLVRRRPDGPSSLAVAAILVLIWNPQQLLLPGFIFSFSVVTGLIVFYSPMSGPVMNVFKPDDFSIESDPPWKRALRTAGRWFAGIILTSMIAWCVSAPLTAKYFNLFSPVALLGNLLVIPGAFVVVLTGCLTLISSFIHPVLVEVFNHANRFFIATLVDWIELLARLPAGHGYVRSPSWIWVAVWYLGLFSLVAFTGRTRRCLATCSCILLLWAGYFDIKRDNVFIDILDVGHGNAAFIDLPGSNDMMIDVGPRHMNWKVRRHLRDRGVDRLHTVVLTHADGDHVGGLRPLMKQIPIDEIWMPPGFDKVHYYRPLIQEIQDAGIKLKTVSRGASGNWPGDVHWEILHPPERHAYRKSNDH